MRPIHSLRIAACTSIFTLSLGWAKSQECTVETDSLKGTYSGECKKGKANGQGKAVGVHSYEGEFKSGQPNGEGTYTWRDGSVYTGAFSKGLQHGKGKMVYRRMNNLDSVVEGYWKKGVYTGQYESPWRLVSKTGTVTEVEVQFDPKGVKQVVIEVENTSGGVKSMRMGEVPKPKITNISILKGYYVDVFQFDGKTKGTQTTLNQVSFPLHVLLAIGQQEVNIEFLEPGRYTVSIKMNN